MRLRSRPTKQQPGKKSTPTAEGLGRSRGGFSTKLHAVVDALGNCLHLVLTPGHWADCTQLPALLAALRQPTGAVVADKAYDTNAVLAAISACHAAPVIPSKTNRNVPRTYDQNLYADRNKAERFFGRLKEARGLPANHTILNHSQELLGSIVYYCYI
ncbi:MAG: IS5 family transposase [Janthinobacterium lividum]